jgi:hypothetical protein
MCLYCLDYQSLQEIRNVDVHFYDRRMNKYNEAEKLKNGREIDIGYQC